MKNSDEYIKDNSLIKTGDVFDFEKFKSKIDEMICNGRRNKHITIFVSYKIGGLAFVFFKTCPHYQFKAHMENIFDTSGIYDFDIVYGSYIIHFLLDNKVGECGYEIV